MIRTLRPVHACSCFLIAIALPTVAGCGPSCGTSYPTGTRFRVVVREALDDCHVTLDAGQSYDLVAGPPHEVEAGDGAACEMNFPSAAPPFASSEFEIRSCTGGPARMSVDCRVTLATCLDPSGGASGGLRAWYLALPDEPGDAVRTELRLTFAGGNQCSAESCSARVPVTIAW
jgi:hypothetical protein